MTRCSCLIFSDVVDVDAIANFFNCNNPCTANGSTGNSVNKSLSLATNSTFFKNFFSGVN